MMEMFHPFKHLCEVVWGKDLYLFTLFGPLVHSVDAECKVKRKPKLKQIQIWFTILRLVYPSHRERMKKLVTTIQNPLIVLHLENFLIFFEFFLPAVLFVDIFCLLSLGA